MIDPEGEQLGIVSTREALAKAEELALDLVEISPDAQPPVCRLMDFGKFIFEKKQSEKEAKKKAEKESKAAEEAKKKPATRRKRA